MKKLYVYSKLDFLEFLSNNNWLNKFPERTAVISICNVGESYKHMFDNNHENVLNVEFDDVSEKDPNFIDKETAKRIVEFIDKNISCDIYIHCDAGKSRSQAVARYIMDVYPHDWETRAENNNFAQYEYAIKKSRDILKQPYNDELISILWKTTRSQIEDMIDAYTRKIQAS